ncbi:MAG: M42 family metallopeptidase [Armatimonadota bacterium]
MFELLKQLTELPGPTGMEEPVQAALRDLWGPQALEMWTTPVGNLHAHIGGRGSKMLLAGHADEICLLVRAITDTGFLLLSTGQGEQSNPLPNPLAIGQAVAVLGRDGAVPGVLARASGHVRTVEERLRDRLDWNEVFVDLGLPTRHAVAAAGVTIGAPVIFDVRTRRLGELIVGKAMDDRAALAIMSEVARRVDRKSLAYDLSLVSTVQEEVGLTGAASVAADYEGAIALDVGLVADIPSVPTERFPARLGGGPILGIKDNFVHYSRRLLGGLQRIADRERIPTQPLVFSRYTSDGVAFVRSGIPTALLAYGTRYTHSPFEMVHLRDLEQSVALLMAFLTTPPDAA